MEPIVLDASITMAWCFDDEATPYTEELLNWCAAGTRVYVASIWPLEVTNVLLNAQRKGRVTQKKVEEFLELLLNLPIHIEAVLAQRVFSNIRKLADVHRLTSYDAAYLDLPCAADYPLLRLMMT